MTDKQTYEVRFENEQRLSGVFVSVEAESPEEAVVLARTAGNVPQQFDVVELCTVTRLPVPLPTDENGE